MTTRTLIGSVCLCVLAACGLEGMFFNAKHRQQDRPASVIRGAIGGGVTEEHLTVLDGDGEVIEPFSRKVANGRYEIRLPSARYAFARVQVRAGNFALRALVPFVGEESAVDGVDLDPRNVTETLVVEARLSAGIAGEPSRLQQLTPAAYVGDGLTSGTRTVMRAAMEASGPTRELLQMVGRLMTLADSSANYPDAFFSPAVLTTAFTVSQSPIAAGFLSLNPFDYDGIAGLESSSAEFDAALAQVAQLYQPGGCPDAGNVRVVFSVDFNAGSMDGNCAVADRFKWVTDKPGKQMFFTGGIHEDSVITARQRPDVDRLLGQWVPNQVPMYDDGTNGDEVAGDNVWTISFDLPRGLRVAYKYTWGTRGAVWTGSEEWPGNQRLLEIVDVNGDNFVARRDVFGDEATNKDRSNLNNAGTGILTWSTDLHGCGPEAREKPFTVHTMCQCNVAWTTPRAVGPLTIACPAP